VTEIVPRFAVIPTHDRPRELIRCLESLYPQSDFIVVIDNACEPRVSSYVRVPKVRVFRSDEQPPNLSELWNIGIKMSHEYTQRDLNARDWDVAIINDDAVLPPTWWDDVSNAMRQYGAQAGCMNGNLPTMIHGPNAVPSVATRLTGWAFMLRGESGIHADERFRWWCGDDDISMQARKMSGLVVVPGTVENTLANTTTVGELAAQSARDMQSFVDKWGVRPW
jgi:glycosyltransferase involved in cell wall biosynthesis